MPGGARLALVDLKPSAVSRLPLPPPPSAAEGAGQHDPVPPDPASRALTKAEVAAHNEDGDMWVIIDGDVYDLSRFARMHPGGEVVLAPYAGKDATEAFYGLHRVSVLQRYRRLRIGRLDGADGVPLVDRHCAAGVSGVAYAEPAWLQGFRSPYYTASHRQYRDAVARLLVTEMQPPPGRRSRQHVANAPGAQNRRGAAPHPHPRCGAAGRPPDASQFKKMGARGQ
eukprot:gene4225-2922_t